MKEINKEELLCRMRKVFRSIIFKSKPTDEEIKELKKHIKRAENKP